MPNYSHDFASQPEAGPAVETLKLIFHLIIPIFSRDYS